MKKQLLLLALLFCLTNLNAQPGCTDPQASNYDASATTNDGSCIYPATSASLSLVANLPETLVEISGLAHTNAGLWGHNDASNANEIYELDSMTGAVLHEALVIGDNMDWEDMAESSTNIFVGDFGNNPGNRMDLKIYRLNKSELGNNIMNTEVISFSYSDQVDFSENWNNNDYDCEAFIFHNDSLHLFTKNWVDNQTRHYVLPNEPGTHTAELRESFDVNGLITGADVNSDGDIVLLGYTEVGFNFLWLLFDYPGNQFFGGNKRRIELGTALTNSQTEGIAFRNKYEGFICSEQFDVGQTELPPKLLNFSIEEWISTPSAVIEEASAIAEVFPNPFDDRFWLSFSENQSTIFDISLVNALGETIWQEQRRAVGPLEFDGMATIAPGMYTLIIQNREATWYRKLIKE